MDIQGITFQENKMDMLDGVIKPVKCFKGEIPEKLRNMIGGNLYEITALLHNRGYNSVLHPIIFEIRNRIPRIVGFRKNNSGVLKEFIILTVDENECFIGELCKDDRIVDCAKETFLILSIALRKLNFWIDAMEVYTRNTEIEADEDCYVLQYDWNKTVGDAGFVIVSIGYTLEELENNGKPVPSKKTKSLIEEEKVHKFWTVQKKEIIENIKNNVRYQPDFSKCDALKIQPELKNLYNMMLKSFNNVNGENLPGLIFSFADSDNEKISSIKDIEAFYLFIHQKRSAITSLWNQLCKQDVVIVELNYDEGFNPIFVDINDFQFLMPPVMLMPPYTEKELERICSNISVGQTMKSIFPSGIMQAHLPYIKVENIVNIYSMFELDENINC